MMVHITPDERKCLMYLVQSEIMHRTHKSHGKHDQMLDSLLGKLTPLTEGELNDGPGETADSGAPKE